MEMLNKEEPGHDALDAVEGNKGTTGKSRIFKRVLIAVYIVVSVAAIAYSGMSLFYKYERRRELADRDFFPVQDYNGENVNIFEFERYLESHGAERIIKGFYYTDNGNTAVCYDFLKDDVRYVLENEIWADAYYDSLSIKSRLSVYRDDVIYRTHYQEGIDNIMDYRSPMWVNMDVYRLLRGVIDGDTANGQECPFEGLGVAHYAEDINGNIIRHED